jgi:hypothetical protein
MMHSTSRTEPTVKRMTASVPVGDGGSFIAIVMWDSERRWIWRGRYRCSCGELSKTSLALSRNREGCKYPVHVRRPLLVKQKQ